VVDLSETSEAGGKSATGRTGLTRHASLAFRACRAPRLRHEPSWIMRAGRRVWSIFTKWGQSVKRTDDSPHPRTTIGDRGGPPNLL